MLLRTFMVFHDCGHNSYSPNKIMNYLCGSTYGIFIMNPFSWNSQHYIHHLVNGNIDNNYQHKWSETIQYTVDEYKLLDSKYKLFYRIMREPLIYFLFFPIFQNYFIFRFSIFEKNGYNYTTLQKYTDWIINTIGVFVQQYVFYKYSILVHYNIAHYLSSILTLLLFHSQHTFNPGYITNNDSWSFRDSSFKGSSFIEIPSFLKYFTMGIEYHYIHHYSTRIPGYHLQKYHETTNFCVENDIITLSIKDVITNLSLSLYDTEKDKFVSFYEIEKKSV